VRRQEERRRGGADQRLVTVTERRRKKKKRSVFWRYSLQCWNMLGAHKCRHDRHVHTLTHSKTPTKLKIGQKNISLLARKK